MNIQDRKKRKGQAVVELAIFGTTLIILTLVAYDLASHIGISQSLASAARETARVFVAEDGTKEVTDITEGLSDDAFEASKRIATQMLAPSDLSINESGEAIYTPDADDNQNWKFIMSIIRRHDLDDDGTDELVIAGSEKYPTNGNSIFQTRIKTERKSDTAGDEFLEIKNANELNLDITIMRKKGSMVAVEMFYEAEFLTGLDNLASWTNYNQMYEIAFY